MPNKPIDTGLKYIVLAEADTGLVLALFLMNKQMPHLEASGGHKVVAWMFDLLTTCGVPDGTDFLNQNYEVTQCAVAVF